MIGLIPALQARQGLGPACPLPGNHPVVRLIAKRWMARQRRVPLSDPLEVFVPQIIRPTPLPSGAFSPVANAQLALGLMRRSGVSPWLGTRWRS